MALVALGGACGFLAIYTDYAVNARILSNLRAKVELLPISSIEKGQLLSDVYMHNPRGRSAIGFMRSFANETNFPTDVPISTGCTGLLLRFIAESTNCIDYLNSNFLSGLAPQCPAADAVADDLLRTCSIDVGL